MEEAMEQVVNEIAYIIAVKVSGRCGTERCNHYDDCNICLADQILSITEILIKDPDQSLPQLEPGMFPQIGACVSDGYLRGIKDMSDRVKVLPKEEK